MIGSRTASASPVMASGRVKWHRPPEYFAEIQWRGTHALDGGGALMNQGIHTVDLLQWFFGRGGVGVGIRRYPRPCDRSRRHSRG